MIRLRDLSVECDFKTRIVLILLQFAPLAPAGGFLLRRKG